jgi:hypothetical protein
MGFDPEREGGFREVDDPNRRIIQFWGPGSSLDGKPDFERVFGSQFVESKGGGEAQNSEWNPLRDFEEGLVGGDWGFFCAVQTATHALDLPGFSEVPEMRTGYGEAFELFRAHESPFPDEGPDMFHFLHHMVTSLVSGGLRDLLCRQFPEGDATWAQPQLLGFVDRLQVLV